MNLSVLLGTAVEGKAELDYSEALETFGLRFRPSRRPQRPPGRAWLGITTATTPAGQSCRRCGAGHRRSSPG